MFWVPKQRVTNLERCAVCATLGVGAVAVFLSRRHRRIVQERKALEASFDDSIDVCKVGFARKRVPKQIDVIVIGSGPSGLVCAATLTKSAGLCCVVLEQHDVAGGSTHVFELQEAGLKAEFDTGLHYIGGKFWKPETNMRRILDDLGDAEIKWHPMDSNYDHAVIGSDTYAIPAGRKALRDMLVSKFPNEEAAIDGYFAAVSEQQSCAGMFFAAGLIAGLLPKCCRWVLNSLKKPHEQVSDKSLTQVLTDLGCSPQLRGVIGYHWGNMGLPPGKISFAPFAMMANHYFEGACYPVGGSKTIATALCKCVVKHGGRVFVRSPVKRILVEHGRAKGVELKNGQQLLARVGIVCTGGVRNTFCKLLADTEPRVVEVRRELEFIPPSVHHLQLFLILKEMDLPASNWWVSLSGGDHDANEDKTAENGVDGEMNHAFISFPSAKDPIWKERYPGTSTCIVISGSSFDYFAAWADRKPQHRGPDYEALKERLTQKMMGVLFQAFPQIREQIVYHEMGTPLSTQYYLGSTTGESYGLACTSQRFRCRDLKPVTDISGLWISGQDTISPGVAGALCSGFLTALAVKPLLALKHFDWVADL